MMYETFCNSGTIVRGFCSLAHTHQVDLGTSRFLVNAKIVACWNQCGREGENRVGEWDSMKRYMGDNVRHSRWITVNISFILFQICPTLGFQT